PPTDAAATVEGPATAEPASGPSLSTGPWEQRRVAWLYVVIDVAEGSPLAPATRALDVVSEKIEAFGGRVEETGPTVLLAVFGLAPVEDAARRAAHTAFAIQKAAERAGLLDGGGRNAIHFQAALIRFSGGVAGIGP